MQTKAILVCVLLLPLVGSVNRRGGPLRAFPTSSPRNVPAELRLLLTRGRDLLAAGRYLEAARVNLKGYESSQQQGQLGQAIRFLNNRGAGLFAAFQYREAMAAFLEARRLAQATGDREMAAALSINISSIYLQMGEIPSAMEVARRGLEEMRRAGGSDYRGPLLMNLAKLTARQGQVDAAVPLFEEAVEEASRRADPVASAQAWNALGFELLKAGRLDAAERAMVEAFRLRRLNGNRELDNSYRGLGLLRLKQGDLQGAVGLLDAAVSWSAQNPGRVADWIAYHLRGQAYLALGRTSDAVADFSTALDRARRLRLQVLPADAVRVSLDVTLHEVYSAFLRAAARLYFHRSDPRLLARAFQAAEENRAASLRALIADREWPQRLPRSYGEKLARLRAVESALIRKPSPALQAEARALQVALTEMETAAGLDVGAPRPESGPDSLLAAAAAALRPEDCLLSFHLGEEESYLWAVTRASAEWHRLPGRADLETRVAAFEAAVAGGHAGAAALGRGLYDTLFGALTSGPRTRPHWLLALDGPLFRLPAAALVVAGQAGPPAFLVERHSLRVLPSAHLLLSPDAQPPAAPGPFVGLGDPIYNPADPRWSGDRPARSDAAVLARLAGSAREIRVCAAAWDAASAPLLLEGAAACRSRLLEALQRRPAVAHLATHVVTSQQQAGGLIALTATTAGAPELLGPTEIASWRVPLGLVALSGCSSGAGRALPGAGLMGLTRAWLAAGAAAVLASRWPTPDETGELFQSFYRQYRRLPEESPASALQRAQIEMLRSPSWRSAPK